MVLHVLFSIKFEAYRLYKVYLYTQQVELGSPKVF